MRPFRLDQLPRFSPWPSALLRQNPEIHPKDPQEIQREFGVEKWGRLLERSEETGLASLSTIDSWYYHGVRDMPGVVAGRLTLMTAAEAKSTYLSLLEDLLSDVDCGKLVELGCGYGSILLDLVLRGKLRVQTAWGGEYTESGVALAQRIALAEGLDVGIGRFDFDSPGMAGIPVSEGSGILTSFAAVYARDARRTVRSILSSSPAWVLHIEPCLEHSVPDSILGLMRKRYAQVNDYNVGLLGELLSFQDEGRLEILKVRPDMFGTNCLLPGSAILWRPVRRGDA